MITSPERGQIYDSRSTGGWMGIQADAKSIFWGGSVRFAEERVRDELIVYSGASIISPSFSPIHSAIIGSNSSKAGCSPSSTLAATRDDESSKNASRFERGIVIFMRIKCHFVY